MTLPIDLVLLRHGQSEGNAAKRIAEGGDRSVYTHAFLQRHTSTWRLTDRGQRQAQRAGAWLRSAFPQGFSRHTTSDYIRALETAGRLGLPNASWFCDSYLTERDWGELDRCPQHEREERFGEALRLRKTEPFFWKPPNGESFNNVCLRVDRHLDTLHRASSDTDSEIVVCHGEVIWAFRVRIERLPQAAFRALHLSENPDDRIYNCQIIHYTRRNPDTGEIIPFIGWMRTVRASDMPIRDMGWKKIVRATFSNDDLIRLAEEVPRMIT